MAVTYQSYTYKEHTVYVGLEDLGNGYYNIGVIVKGPYLTYKTYSRRDVPQASLQSTLSELGTQIRSDIDKAIEEAQANTGEEENTGETTTNNCQPGTVIDSSTGTYNNHTITGKKIDNCNGTYKVEIIVSGPLVNKTYTKDGLTDANYTTETVKLINEAKAEIDAAYNTGTTEETGETENTGGTTEQTGNTGTSLTESTSETTQIYTAPNGKKYIIHYDPARFPESPYWFDGGHGVKLNKTLEEAKYVIDATNGPDVPNDMLGEYYTGQVDWGSLSSGTGETTTGETTTGETATGETGEGAGEFGTGMESGPNATIPLTGKEDVDKYLRSMAEYNTELNNWLKQNLDLKVGDWQKILDKIQDADLKGQIADRIRRLNEGFQKAAQNLQAASELERRAQAIYSNENIRKIGEMLKQRGYNEAKAYPAAVYAVMKQRAKLSADIYKIKSEFEKTLANLEAQRAQLEDNIRREGIEVDKWIIDKYAQITDQINKLRQVYEQYVINNTDRYIMKPMIDIMSSNWQVELQLIAKEKEAQLLNANPTVKIMEASKIFGSDWAYVDASVLAYANRSWQEFLTKAAESIRKNKLAEQIKIMEEQTEQQKELMQFQYDLENSSSESE